MTEIGALPGWGLLLVAIAVYGYPAAGASRGDARALLTRLRGEVRAAAGRTQRLRRLGLAAGVAVGTAGALMFSSAAGFALACATVVGSRLGIDALERRRRTRADLADGECLQALTAELRAGQDMAAAFDGASTVLGSPVARSLAAAAAAIRIGADPADVLHRCAARDTSPVTGQLAGLLSISARYGIALAEAIDVLDDEVRDQLAHQREITGLLAGPSMTASLLSTLPLLGIGLGQAMGADPLHVLLHTSAGSIALVAGVLLALAGIVWTRLLVDRARTA